MRTVYRIIYSLLCVGVLLITTLISGCVAPDLDSHISEIHLGVSLTSETVRCYVKDDILRIECIDPGLDTYSLSITLFSLTARQVLCQIDLGEGDWYTDWTDDGFYAASMDQRTLSLYSTNGTLKEQRDFPQQVKQVSFFMMNPAGTTYFIGAGDEGRLYLYHTEQKTLNDVGQMLFGYQNPLTYQDGYFYLEGETDLLRMKENGDYAETAYCQLNNTVKFPEMGINVDEKVLQVVRPDTEGALQFSKTKDELYPLTADNTRFAVSDGDKTVYVYNLNSDIVHPFEFQHPIHDAVFYKEALLVFIKNHNAFELYMTTCGIAPTLQASTMMQHTSTSATPTTPTSATVAPSVYEPTSASPTDLTQPTAQKPTSSSPTDATQPSTKGHKIKGVPVIHQMPDYPTGCESVSAIMALSYWKEEVTLDEFIDRHLPKSAYFHSENGIYCGPNPYEYFIGNPRSSNSYGCMAPVIEKALVNYFGSNERVVNTTGTSLKELCATYIDKDIPVLTWVTIGMLDTYSSAKWRLEDGTLFEWPANEHCMVLIGYDENYYYFNDPYRGQVKQYAKWLVEKRYKEMGTQSVVITG